MKGKESVKGAMRFYKGRRVIVCMQDESAV